MGLDKSPGVWEFPVGNSVHEGEEHMGVARYRVELTAAERKELERITRKQTSGQALVRRARIILLADAGMAHRDIAEELGLSRHSGVSDWIKRWRDRADEPIGQRLSDAPSSGAPPKVAAEQVCQLVALACEPPRTYGRPVTHWTHRELAEELQNQGIVASISASQVGRLLKKRCATASQPLLVERQGR
jgi:putative transposase